MLSSGLLPIKVGDRVELHPATNAWMMGDRCGEVIREGRKYAHVKMDRSGRVRKVPFHLLGRNITQDVWA